MTPIAPEITAFLQERLPLEQGASENTRESYAHAFRLLFAFVSTLRRVRPSDITVEHLDAITVLAFLEHLEKVRGNSPSSRNARLAAIKALMRFIEFRVPSSLDQVRRIRAIPMKRTNSRLVPYLTIDEMKAVLGQPDPRTRTGVRDRAMLYVAFTVGARVSELIGIRLDDLTLQPRALVRIRGKGRCERILPMSKETTQALRAWLNIRAAAMAPEIFLNTQGVPMTRAGFEYILRKHVKRASAACPSLVRKRVSPHVLRHTCAMITLQATRDIRKVSLWLGHASMQTTEVYTRADPTEKIEAVNAIVPAPLRRGRFRPSDRLLEYLRSPDKVPHSRAQMASLGRLREPRRLRAPVANASRTRL